MLKAAVSPLEQQYQIIDQHFCKNGLSERAISENYHRSDTMGRKMNAEQHNALNDFVL